MKIIVVDVQKGITDERLYDFNGFIKNISQILASARKNNVEVIYVQHDDGPGTGFSIGDKDFEIADQIAPMTGERVFLKILIVSSEIKAGGQNGCLSVKRGGS